MADGRMLKKQISQSRRLADLQTDGARMLYTWIIPHLDIEGRMSADPYVIKGQVVPRLKGMTTEIIEEYLLDMHSVGVITLYTFDGDKYLQLRKFKDHQSLRPGKEAASRIPPPDVPSPAQIPDKGGSSPAKDKIREDKISKVNAREEGNTPPVDNSLYEAYLKTMQPLYEKALQIYPRLNVSLFLSNHKPHKGNEPAHYKAMEHAITKLIDGSKQKLFESPYKYLEKIYISELQNYNAAATEEESKQFKGGNLKGIFNGMGLSVC